MHLEDPEYGEDLTIDGKRWHIPSLETCMERAEASLQGVLDRLGIDPVDIIAVKDPDSPGEYRKRKYPEYKAGREKRPKQFYAVLNQFIADFCDLIMKSGGICATPRVVATLEADDMINELCQRIPDCIVYTKDKDLLACPAKHHLIDKELDPVKFPVPREYIRLYRSIVTGDTSDNIPGCKGFGEKAWEKMFELIGADGVAELDKMVQEKRLHELASEVDDFKPFQKLVDQADQIYLSYDLMGFEKVPAHRVKWEARVTECDQTLVTADNFDRCFSEVQSALVGARHAVIDFESDVCEEARKWLEGTFDPETGKQAVLVDVMGSEPVGMGLKIGSSCWYFSVDHAETNNIKLEQLRQVIELLKPATVLAHNAGGFENVILHNHFGGFLLGMIDTRLAASYVDENNGLGLKQLSKTWLQYDQTTYDQVLDGRRGMRDITGEQVVQYGIDDVIVADSLWNLFSVIMKYENTFDVFMEVERDSLFVTSLCFINGVEFNWEAYHKLREENNAKIKELEAFIEVQLLLHFGYGQTTFQPLPALATKGSVNVLYETVTGKKFASKARTVKGCLSDIDDERVLKAVQQGTEAMNKLYEEHWKPSCSLNIRSPKQMQDILYNLLECPVRILNPPTDAMRKAGKDGTPATNEAAIENAIAWKDTTEEGVALLRAILDLKGALTRESLFLRKYPSLVHWKTGRIHGSMMQCGTTTRRFTHSAPNWGQSSKKKGKEMRDVMKAPEGYKLISLDINSQELKLAAWASQDENFLACYTGPEETRKDVHSLAGYAVSQKAGDTTFTSYEDFKQKVDAGDPKAKKYRAAGKGVNFGAQYGVRAKKLSWMLKVSEGEAQQFLDARCEAFPKLPIATEAWNGLCQRRKYATTMKGARRHLHRQFAMARSQGDIDAARRLCFSFLIQSSSAEQIKLAMARLWKAGVFEEGKGYPITVIHDEIVGIIRKDVLDEMIPIWHACVIQPYADMEIEVGSDPEVGETFGSLEKYPLVK